MAKRRLSLDLAEDLQMNGEEDTFVNTEVEFDVEGGELPGNEDVRMEVDNKFRNFRRSNGRGYRGEGDVGWYQQRNTRRSNELLSGNRQAKNGVAIPFIAPVNREILDFTE